MKTSHLPNFTCLSADDQTKLYASRRDRLRAKLKARGMDALLVTQPANRFYLSGFELHDSQPNESSGCLLITTSGRDWLATDSRYADAAERLWPKDSIFIYSASISQSLAQLMAENGSLIGAEFKDISLAFYANLAKYKAPALLPADGMVEALRSIKDAYELECLHRSFDLNHQMLHWLEKELCGQTFHNLTERELAWEIEKYFRENGAQELAFSTIAASGKNSALPHAIPGSDKIVDSGLLLADVGCRVDNYCSDQTRTFWLTTNPPDYFTKAMDLVKNAQTQAISIMRPGVSCADVYKAARRVFEEAGVEKYFTHGLGHGVGLETHEEPSLNPRNTKPLEAGMVVTVEPGLYFQEWGGIRWEHTVIVEDNGVALL